MSSSSRVSSRFDNIDHILHGDSFELIKDIPDGSVDLILEDMPYNMIDCKWDRKIDLVHYWNSRLRILKKNGVIALMAVQPFATDVINSNRELFRYDIIWFKNNKVGALNANKMPLRQHEILLIFYKNRPTYNPQKVFTGVKRECWSDAPGEVYGKVIKWHYKNTDGFYHPTSVLKIDVERSRFNTKVKRMDRHPTQKPVALFEWIIKTYTNENEIVFDGFSGGGTTAIAASGTNRRFIAVEKEKKYFDLSMRKLKKYRLELEPELKLRIQNGKRTLH